MDINSIKSGDIITIKSNQYLVQGYIAEDNVFVLARIYHDSNIQHLMDTLQSNYEISPEELTNLIKKYGGVKMEKNEMILINSKCNFLSHNCSSNIFYKKPICKVHYQKAV